MSIEYPFIEGISYMYFTGPAYYKIKEDGGFKIKIRQPYWEIHKWGLIDLTTWLDVDEDADEEELKEFVKTYEQPIISRAERREITRKYFIAYNELKSK
tara:strand:+ start:81 stop:377 length:297 start_codon:yes stop_codon:yes gene_type:complete